MCGITGFIGHHTRMSPERVIRSMYNSLQHRGPDDEGMWLDALNQVGLGHRRLSVLDLSEAGHQPMQSVSGRYVLLFNGEIYNHLTLRQQLDTDRLQPTQWRGHSDTETLLAGIETWGIEKTLQQSVGMFALAVWDRRKKELILARDRMGEKPLYYGWCNSGFVFGSELKALRQYPGFINTISRDALLLYFRYSYIPAPCSIYQNIYKLEAGCLLTLALSATKQAPEQIPHTPYNDNGLTISRYWALKDLTGSGPTSSAQDEQTQLTYLESVLQKSVRLQSIADVPLGAFLSGGLDSSLITALMQVQSSRPVKTFTIGFTETGYNEAEYARAVAHHLQTDHTELYVHSTQARDVIPLLPDLYDEPFADSSQIPSFLIAQMASEHVKVALSGDGGDELFGGYNRYFWAPRIWNKASLLPYGLRQHIVGVALRLSSLLSNNKLGLNRLMSAKVRAALPGDKLQKLARNLESVRDIDQFYTNLIAEWKNPEHLVINGREPQTLITNKTHWPELSEPSLQMMYLDAMTYLPDDILCKVDRAAMGVSLETRVPFLDHRVVEAAWKLPLNMKIRNGRGKWALRRILYKHVPKELIERPKQGFAVPLGDWLRGPLREWTHHLLDPDRLAREGYLRHEPIHKKWDEHLTGKRNWEHSLWSVLMFQAWLERQQECS